MELQVEIGLISAVTNNEIQNSTNHTSLKDIFNTVHKLGIILNSSI